MICLEGELLLWNVREVLSVVLWFIAKLAVIPVRDFSLHIPSPVILTFV